MVPSRRPRAGASRQQPPLSSSTTAANTDGESKCGQQNQEIDPSGFTSAAAPAVADEPVVGDRPVGHQTNSGPSVMSRSTNSVEPVMYSASGAATQAIAPGDLLGLAHPAPADLPLTWRRLSGLSISFWFLPPDAPRPRPPRLGPLRPTARLGRHATPVHGLFISGAGTAPTGGIAGIPGRMAAQALLGSHRPHANDLNLLSEDIDPADGEMIRKFPQALSHIGLIEAAWAIQEAQAQRHDKGKDDGQAE